MFFLERLKASISYSSSKLKYALLSPNLMFMKPSYGMVDFLSNVKSQSSHFDSFNSFTCFTSACHPIVVITENASRQRWKFLWCVYKHENWKNNTKTHRFVLLPCRRHPPKRVTGSNSPGSGPRRSEPEKKIRVARKRGKLLRRWGSVVMGQVGPNVKMNVKSQHPLLMSIGAVLVLFGFEPHPNGFWIRNCSHSSTGASHKLQSEPKDDIRICRTCTLRDWIAHRLPTTHAVHQSSVPQQFALSEASWNAWNFQVRATKLWESCREQRALAKPFLAVHAQLPNCHWGWSGVRTWKLGTQLAKWKKNECQKICFL